MSAIAYGGLIPITSMASPAVISLSQTSEINADDAIQTFTSPPTKVQHIDGEIRDYNSLLTQKIWFTFMFW